MGSKHRLSPIEHIFPGATSAAAAADIMTVWRMLMRRFGLIEKNVPQATGSWILASFVVLPFFEAAVG